MDEKMAFEELTQASLVLAATESGRCDLYTMVLDNMLEKIPVRQVRKPSHGRNCLSGIDATSANWTHTMVEVHEPLFFLRLLA